MIESANYDQNQRIEWTTSFLLWRLEHLDSSVRGNWIYRLFGNVARRRERLRNKIVASGSRCLRTVLKKSRHEGWGYRADVYSIIEEIVDEPVDVFIRGLSDPDSEIRCSCSKWLRDTGKGAVRAVGPLIDYMRQHPVVGDVTTTLQFMEVDATEPIVNLITDSDAPWHARMEACYYFTAKIRSEAAKKLREFTGNQSEDEDLRAVVEKILKDFADDEN